MTREEAAEVLDNLCTRLNCEDDISGAEARAFHIALTALSGWVRTAYRVPTEADGNPVMAVYKNAENGFMLHEVVAAEWLRMNHAMYPYWQPLPPLPETVGLEGTKINGGE